MKKYRIIKHIHRFYTEYEVQKRFLGFLWWYNFENIDGWSTGYYFDLNDAKAAIERDQFESTKEIIEL